ncbi:MAG: 5-formyltetrahydrofolate cyclo-ligase [Balneolaceae bacterium]|nr:5-formyltetrahydrofolate cyclo-ligase [Balneolaceae bacterium]MBO6547462.1 5-formyltetrahydrofolate cyclo-ligase [Balneolaceae bacterium]MBO6647591.1 5-formyltetrahydrofolate cyclo-ligase [Balneolaceae bacterium]
MASISEQKSLIRKEVTAKRQLLTVDEWASKSRLIKEVILLSPEYENSDTIHCFISMNERFEVDTQSLIKDILDQGKTLVVPITNFKKGILSHSKLSSFEALKPNKWGVLEPQEFKPVNNDEIDLVLAPLLAADRTGNRLGYGKGFYDRFLSTISAPAFGLLFEEFILENIPTDSFDQKLKGLISEKGFYYS